MCVNDHIKLVGCNDLGRVLFGEQDELPQMYHNVRASVFELGLYAASGPCAISLDGES